MRRTHDPCADRIVIALELCVCLAKGDCALDRMPDRRVIAAIEVFAEIAVTPASQFSSQQNGNEPHVVHFVRPSMRKKRGSRRFEVGRCGFLNVADRRSERRGVLLWLRSRLRQCLNDN